MTKNDKVLQIRAELSEPVLVWNIFHLRNVPEIEETQCSPTRTFQYFDNEPLRQLCSLKRPDRFLLRETIKSHLNQHCDLWRSHHRIVLELNVRVLCV